MKERNKRIARRWMSTALIIAMLFACVINDISLPYVSWAGEKASASDAVRNSRVTLKNQKIEKNDKVQMFVLSDQQDYQPGDTVCLELYIKNNTDEVISEGLLRYKAKGIEEDSAYFEDLNDLYTKISEAEEKAAEAESAAKESKEEETESKVQETESEAQTEESPEQAEESSPVDESDGAEQDSTEETTETASEAEKESSQDAEKPLQTGEPETTAEEKIKEEAKDASGELSGGDILDNEAENTDEDDEEEEEEDDPTRLTEIEIEPGKAYYVNFYYTIDPEIEKIKDQNVEFTFSWADDDALIIKRPSVTEKFQYTVDGLNLLPVAVGGEKKWVQIGEEDEMLLEFGLGRIEEILEEAEMEELEKNPDATISSARRSSASNALIGWDAEDDGKLIGKDDPAVVRNLKLDVETFDLKLNDFTVVPVDENTDDNFGTTVACKFKVSRVNEPGTYYGKVNASYKIKNKTYYTSQAFRVIVKPEEGEMELTGKIGKSEIVMYGDVSAFPKADELSLKISEVTKEQQEKVEEALRKKSEEEGVEIKEYKALDIKLIADGVETEPKGDVKVRFKNVKAEEPEKDEEEAAEEVQPEKQSVVKRFFSRMRSAFRADDEAEPMNIAADDEIKADADKGEANGAEADKAEAGKAEANGAEAGTDKADEVKEDEKTGTAAEDGKSEADSSKSIKVLHLDEENVVTEEMTSEVLENGDIVMDTTHFSIYIVVNVDGNVKEVHVDIIHKAFVDKWQVIKDNETNKMKLSEPDITESSTDYVTRGKQANHIVPGAVMEDGEYGGKQLKRGEYEKQEVEIYSRDINVPVPNGGGTGIGYEIAVENWSKVALGGHYTVKNVQVTNSNYPYGATFEEDGTVNVEDVEGNILIFKKDGTVNRKRKVENGYTQEVVGEEEKKQIEKEYKGKIEQIKLSDKKNDIIINYEPSEGSSDEYVEFHDYNVTRLKNPDTDTGDALKDKMNSGWDPENHKFFTGRVGMNNWDLAQYEERIGIGICNAASHINHGYTSGYQENGYPKTKTVGLLSELVEENLEEIKDKNEEGEEITRYGNVKFKFNLADPGLFEQKDIYTNDHINEKGESDYVAKKYLPNYELQFNRLGDNYTLSSIKNGEEALISDLEYLGKTGQKTYGDRAKLYSNLFWPLDKVEYKDGSGDTAKDGVTRDPLFGKDNWKNNNDEDDLIGGISHHNHFFGMRYDYEFSMGDYIGPMNYYFRGDDDLWVYIDGVLVRDLELGGIHSSVGVYVDLKTWMQENQKNGEPLLKNSAKNGGFELSDAEKKKKHTLTVFFMERGGYGSCCYMSFTLPNAQPIPRLKSAIIPKTVKKVWWDGGNTTYRKKIFVQLLQDGEPHGSRVELKPEENWEHTWLNLPKYTEVGSDKVKHVYTVQEIGDVPGYISKVDGFTITNTRVTNIHAEKKWEDNDNKDNSRPTSVSVQLYQKKGEAEEAVGGPVILKEENSWECTWEKQPLFYGPDAEDKITYSVKEIESDDSLICASKVDDPTITDPLNTDIQVEKRWEANDDADKSKLQSISVQLYKKKGDGGEEAVGGPVILNKENSWKYTWEKMPRFDENNVVISYSVKVIKESGDSLNDGYAVSYEGNETSGFTITNTQVTTHYVTKIWDDDENKNNLRPTTIDVQLQIKVKSEKDANGMPVKDANGNYVPEKDTNGNYMPTEDEDGVYVPFGDGKLIPLSSQVGWHHIWTNLPKYSIAKNKNGTVQKDENGKVVYIENQYKAVEMQDYENHQFYHLVDPEKQPNKGNEGTIITNKLVDLHELPVTGGPGTLWYTFGGLVLMAFALMYNILRRRKVLI